MASKDERAAPPQERVDRWMVILLAAIFALLTIPRWLDEGPDRARGPSSASESEGTVWLARAEGGAGR